jgi:CHAD domain-containing protein
MKTTRERERKFDAPEGFALPDLPGRPIPVRTLQSTYHDTGDLRLLRQGVTFRHRTEDGAAPGAWQLKLPSAGDRMEVEVEGPPGEAPARLTDLLTAVVRGRELHPVATLVTLRAGTLAERDGRAVAEVVRDDVTAMVGSEPDQRFVELEIELVDGGTGADLKRLASSLTRAGARPADMRPKLLRALGIARNAPPAPPRRTAAALEHVRAALAEQAREMVAHDPGTRLGADPEELHDLRVAVRRARAILRSARLLLDRTWADELRAELKWIAGELGHVRDMDVLGGYLAEQVELLPRDERSDAGPIVEALAEGHDVLRERLLAAMRSPRYLALLDAMDAAATAPVPSGRARSLRKIAEREHRKLAAAIKALGPDPADDELHAVRIEAKRARYAAELAVGAVGAPAARYVRVIKDLQDVLGEHQDAVVAEERIEATARRVAASGDAISVAFAAGRLAQLQVERRHDARRAWPAAWRRVAREGRRAWS